MTNDAQEPTDTSISETLNQRGTRYGEFTDNAALSTALRSMIMQQHAHFHPDEPLEPYMLEALIMICHKLARIATGDSKYDDSWHDIAGYSELVVKILQNQPQK